MKKGWAVWCGENLLTPESFIVKKNLELQGIKEWEYMILDMQKKYKQVYFKAYIFPIHTSSVSSPSEYAVF